MAEKTKVLKLSYPHRMIGDGGFAKKEQAYRIEEIIDSVEFVVGQYLTKQEVGAVCEWKHWKVVTSKAK